MNYFFYVEVNQMNLENAKQEFLQYTDPYRKVGERCVLKINHTFRVEALCKQIAKSLSLSKKEIEVAELCGLLHDIGRFEQWKKYQTFEDSKSEDHAELGIQILNTKDYYKKYFTEESIYDIVMNSIRYHNKFKIKEGLTEKEKVFCNIVRDADKIDILYLYTTDDIKLDLKNEPFSDQVYENLIHKKEILKENLKTKGDILSVALGFAFDINYPESFRILKEKDYFNRVIDLYKERNQNEKMQEQLEEIRKTIENYIEEKVKC